MRAIRPCGYGHPALPYCLRTIAVVYWTAYYHKDTVAHHPLPAKHLQLVPSAGIETYASWILTPSRADGEEERSNRFRSDNDVLGCARLDDYRNSGYDRGHMAPAGDIRHCIFSFHLLYLLIAMARESISTTA